MTNGWTTYFIWVVRREGELIDTRTSAVVSGRRGLVERRLILQPQIWQLVGLKC